MASKKVKAPEEVNASEEVKAPEEVNASEEVKARVLFDFEDLQDNVIRHSGDIFSVTRTRFDEINKKTKEMFNTDYVEEVLEEGK
ncbi:hypothetical protein [Peptostreptococcus sp.]|uniref:hypothetical protein n=1 Tax=Peptostreptococcus sp. TaxID=1262 RepID=UPI001CAED6DD|nr:hypothetical protein [Peptostreptococcus sp.]MBF1049672.1 hypothetical protein [Peptostreptococcus sp.]